MAEDLGVVPPFVRKTLVGLAIPGYRVLRWEKDDRVFRNPHDFPTVSLVTTGTHDTETLREWWESTTDEERTAAAQAWPELEGLVPLAGDLHPRGAPRGCWPPRSTPPPTSASSPGRT